MNLFLRELIIVGVKLGVGIDLQLFTIAGHVRVVGLVLRGPGVARFRFGEDRVGLGPWDNRCGLRSRLSESVGEVTGGERRGLRRQGRGSYPGLFQRWRTLLWSRRPTTLNWRVRETFDLHKKYKNL